MHTTKAIRPTKATTTSKRSTHRPALKTAKRHISKSKRFETIVESIKYTVPKSRIKQSKSHAVVDFRDEDGNQAEYPDPITFDEARMASNARKDAETQKYQDHLAAGGAPRKFSLRKQYLYNRNRETIGKAKAILVIQPSSDPEFFEIMHQLGDAWTTAHFRNGLVHLHDKPYAKLKEFFKGPVRVLLQNDEAKVMGSVKKLRKVLGNYPNCLFLGGAIDGFAGVATDFDQLKPFESKNHVQQQLIHTLSAINQLIPAIDYPTKSLAQVVNHHEKEVQKQAASV